MKKVELLSPAGNIEVLKAAILNGADAVYIGGKNYGARKFSLNFTNEEIVESIKFAHIYNSKVYVTVNTLIFENELEECLNYIKFLHQNNVDAIIMQDIGLIKLVRQTLPNLEIHASTQAHNHNKNDLILLQELGVSRVVLARELSLDEINNLDVDIEKEIFIHGALCVSYSGCCLFSSLNGGRSGNRGECVGSCRLPYLLQQDDKTIIENYPLSMKDLCTLPILENILNSNITALKIEGRMKSLDYVAFVTRLYRKLIDEYYATNKITILEEDMIKLKKLYNREFTTGFLNKQSDVVNHKTSNHIGIKIGEVVEIADKIKIKLSSDLHQEDGIRLLDNGMIVNYLYNAEGLLVNEVLANNYAYIDNKIGLTEKCDVLKTTDYLLTKEITAYKPKKVNVNIEVKAILNSDFLITMSDETTSVSLSKNIIMEAKNAPITKEKIQEQISKLGDTPYVLNEFKITISDNIFIQIKALNDIRRELVELFIAKKIEIKPIIFKEYVKPTSNKGKIININILVRNEDQLLTALDLKIDNIYVTDYNLYKKYKKPNIFYRIPRVMKDVKYDSENLLITEFGSYNLKTNKLRGDYTLNITNNQTIDYYNKLNQLCLSLEINDYSGLDFSRSEILIYGYVELMIMKYCPTKQFSNCSNCHSKYNLIDSKNNTYAIIKSDCLNTVLSSKPIDKIEEIKQFLNLGITAYRIDLYQETSHEMIEIISKIRKNLL